MNEKAFRNAITMDMALGCSTNSMLHLPAIAHERGIRIDLHEVNRISERTPNLCHLAPAGRHYIEELNECGGIPAVMAELSKKGLLEDNRTIDGTVMDRIRNAKRTGLSLIHIFIAKPLPKSRLVQCLREIMRRTEREKEARCV